nr:hypothetical protein [Tanacetum cinerariifolium]
AQWLFLFAGNCGGGDGVSWVREWQKKMGKVTKKGMAGKSSEQCSLHSNLKRDRGGKRYVYLSTYHKDTTICRLKDTIKSLIKNNKEEIIDHDRCDLATINEELENSVTKLLSENKHLCKEINHVKQELAEYINTPGWNRPAFYDDDDDDDDVDYTIAITPVLSTEKPIDSLSMEDEHLDTILATGSDEVIKSSVEDLVPIPNQFKDFFESNDEFSSTDNDSFSIDNINYVEASPPDSELVRSEVMEIVIPEVGRIDDDILLTIKDNILREKLLNVNLLITKIEAFNDNPTPSSDCKTKSSSTSLNSFLDETNTFHNSLPEFENFYFDLEEISSGSTTTNSDISLSDYEAFSFNNDHIEEISSGSTTTHSDISLFEYDSFVFDPSNDQFPPTDRSDFANEEFVDELAHIISLPEYDCFYFWNLPDLGELMSILNFEIRENLFTTCVNLQIEDNHSPLLAYVSSMGELVQASGP